MSRRRRQLGVRNPDVLLLLPLLAGAHCHARIVETKAVDRSIYFVQVSRLSPQAARSGRPRRISDEAIAWILQVAGQKPKDLGYAQELWTYSRLQAHLRRHAPAAGYAELGTLSQSRLHNLLQQAELRPHKVRYYVERRDPEFEPKMATVLHVYKEVEILKEGLLRGTLR